MRYILRLWFIQSAPWAIHRYLGTVRTLDNTFAVGDTWRNIGRPLFQDYTWQGRIIGVFLRILRILAAYIVYFLAAVVYLFFYLLWIAFPLICLASIVGGFIGPIPVVTP
jgi:hypothetical protein